MSDDWVSKYITGVHNLRLQERRDAKTRRQYAEARADEMFNKVQERVARDVQSLSLVIEFQSLKIMYPYGAPKRFQVEYQPSPRVLLDVEFELTLIKYKYAFFPKDDSGGRPELTMGTLRICSDLDGNLTVYENGSKENSARKFTDESEVSEFLLKPVLNHIDE